MTIDGIRSELPIAADSTHFPEITPPRFPLAILPTPLVEAPRLSAALGGPRILVKRDDMTGFGFGGNKIRNLEFYLADATN